MAHADADDLPAALESFEEALAACERIGDAFRTRVAKWMVAWTLRRLDRPAEALEMQRALKAELEAAGETDPLRRRGARPPGALLTLAGVRSRT